MKGYRFYAEMPEERKSKSASKAYPHFPWGVKELSRRAEDGFRACLVAVIMDPNRPGTPWYRHSGMIESLSVAIDGNHSSYAVNGVSRKYLRERTTRIPVALARKLSPELFVRLGSGS